MPERMVERILAARVYDVARETPLEPARRLSARLGTRVLLKREDLQPVFSFKLRGAYNLMSRLSPLERERGVIAASAGNHSQGVALAASRLGLHARVLMPTTTPQIKIDAVSDLGAEVILHGETYDEADARARAEAERDGLRMVPPYDDLDVIAGQGTIAVEVLRQHLVPVGGGGLIAGIASYVKFLRPETQVIGVEPDDAACLHAALRAGRPVELDSVGLFADGVAVRQVGRHPWELVQDRVDGVVRVNTDAICAAILDIFEDTRTMAEPAGALAVAGLKQFLDEKGEPGGTCVAILSGANINFHRLRHISERAELGQHREAILGVTIPEEPGSFRAFCASLGEPSLTEFNYRYAGPRAAHVFVGLELHDGDRERSAVIARLRASGYGVVDMTEDETAKLHTRHMVGGRVPGLRDERLFRFEFPERPGALGRFLEQMGRGWNITLFHYRNHGAAFGRVLLGLQVPPGDEARFAAFLDDTGFRYVEETGNPAYRLFLASD